MLETRTVTGGSLMTVAMTVTATTGHIIIFDVMSATLMTIMAGMEDMGVLFATATIATNARSISTRNAMDSISSSIWSVKASGWK
jgi:hypothetical protein